LSERIPYLIPRIQLIDESLFFLSILHRKELKKKTRDYPLRKKIIKFSPVSSSLGLTTIARVNKTGCAPVRCRWKHGGGPAAAAASAAVAAARSMATVHSAT